MADNPPPVAGDMSYGTRRRISLELEFLADSLRSHQVDVGLGIGQMAALMGLGRGQMGRRVREAELAYKETRVWPTILSPAPLGEMESTAIRKWSYAAILEWLSERPVRRVV